MTSTELPVYKTAKVDDLVPYARNSRTHTPTQIDKIAASIKEFGFLNPVITDGDNGIVAGHGRVMAARKLGLETVPILQASHLTESQKRAYIIADNRLALDADWDLEMLQVEFDALSEAGFNTDLTGFNPDELSLLENLDYSILEDEYDLDEKMEDMQSEVRKAILIDFDQNDYDEAMSIITALRKDNEYVGGIILEILRSNSSGK